MKTTVKEVLEKVQRYADAMVRVESLKIQLLLAKEGDKGVKPADELETDLEEAMATVKRLGEERL